MTKQHIFSKRVILISFAVFTAVLLSLFTLQMRSALEGFDLWVGHEDHRLPNIRLVPESCRWAVIDRFIDIQPVETSDAIIFGDSQMFARGANQEELFYTQWLGSDATVVNFSFLAASIFDMRKIADELHRRNVKTPKLIQNINISHFIKLKNVVVPGESEAVTPSKRVLLPERTKGLERLYKNRIICAFRMRKSFTQNSLRTPRYRKLLTNFSQVKLPDFFVNFDRNDFNESVPQHVESFKNISDNPIFITAPMAYDKFELYNFEIENLDKLSLAFQKLCRQHPKIDCLDLSRAITSEGFMDLIHMNATGHKKLGETLKAVTEKK